MRYFRRVDTAAYATSIRLKRLGQVTDMSNKRGLSNCDLVTKKIWKFCTPDEDIFPIIVVCHRSLRRSSTNTCLRTESQSTELPICYQNQLEAWSFRSKEVVAYCDRPKLRDATPNCAALTQGQDTPQDNQCHVMTRFCVTQPPPNRVPSSALPSLTPASHSNDSRFSSISTVPRWTHQK